MSESELWDNDQALEKARTAYAYTARMWPEEAPPSALEALGAADRLVLEAEEARDWPRYIEALRELCRVARREASSHLQPASSDASRPMKAKLKGA